MRLLLPNRTRRPSPSLALCSKLPIVGPILHFVPSQLSFKFTTRVKNWLPLLFPPIMDWAVSGKLIRGATLNGSSHITHTFIYNPYSQAITMPSRMSSSSTFKWVALTRLAVKPYMEAYLDACGIVLQRFKGPRYWYQCSNPNCHYENFVQGYSQVWPCGASYRGKPCVGQFYVWKHHAAHVNEPDPSRTPELEAARILALREKRRLRGTENTQFGTAALINSM